MVISSLIIKCLSGMEKQLSEKLAGVDGLTVEGIQEGEVILSLESPSLEAAQRTAGEELAFRSGVLGVYPVYINFGQ